MGSELHEIAEQTFCFSAHRAIQCELRLANLYTINALIVCFTIIAEQLHSSSTEFNWMQIFTDCSLVSMQLENKSHTVYCDQFVK